MTAGSLVRAGRAGQQAPWRWRCGLGHTLEGLSKDALGKPLVFDKQGDIDPATLTTTARQLPRLGQPDHKWVKLNRDMVSYDTTVGDQGIFRHEMTGQGLRQAR